MGVPASTENRMFATSLALKFARYGIPDLEIPILVQRFEDIIQSGNLKGLLSYETEMFAKFMESSDNFEESLFKTLEASHTKNKREVVSPADLAIA